jgi:hypothetical protein
MSKASAKKVPRKAGRPPGRAPRPRINLDNGDVLIPKDEAAQEIGISRRTLTRMRVPSTVVGGVAYISQRGLRQQITDGISAPKKRRARR